jgi:hypothetical protein
MAKATTTRRLADYERSYRQLAAQLAGRSAHGCT